MRRRLSGHMPRVAVVGATGAVGRVMVDLLLERGFDDVRAFASARSAGTQGRRLRVEEATPVARGGLARCFFSAGSRASPALFPGAVRSGALCVDRTEAVPAEPRT